MQLSTAQSEEPKELRTAALAQAEVEPVAWMTHHDEPMLFPTRDEAASYCDDDEEPIALYAAQPSAAPGEGMSATFNPNARLRFQCQGCGHWCDNPQADLDAIRKRGYSSCCPERCMVEDQTNRRLPVASADALQPGGDHE